MPMSLALSICVFFISLTQLVNLLCFHIPLLHYYNSSQITNIFLSFFYRYISLFRYSLSFYELFCCEFFETFVIFLILPYFNLSLLIISSLSSGDAYLSLGTSLLCSFATASEMFCC